VVVVLSSSVLTLLGGHTSLNKVIVITKDQEELYRLKIDDQYEKEIIVDDEGELNHIIIRDGQVWVEEANCPTLECVHQGPLDKKGIIVCLPYHLTIEVIDDEEHEIDMISE
jgi:hypothetical protein